MNIVWTIDAIDCYPQSQGNADVVYNAHWSCTGSDGESARQLVRDKYSDMQTEIDSASTAEEIKTALGI